MEKTSAVNKVEGVVIGVIISYTSAGVPLVAFSANPSDAPLEARATIALGPADIGRDVALLFEEGNVKKPLIIGLMHSPKEHAVPVSEDTEQQQQTDIADGLWTPDDRQTQVIIDGEAVRLTAKREMILKCGKASITLTSAGKVIIRGKYISTRSSGVNRIKGGSVQIN
ncbi:MAG: DUF6484 domain-containing protein [Pseudomonadota bacterium]